MGTKKSLSPVKFTGTIDSWCHPNSGINMTPLFTDTQQKNFCINILPFNAGITAAATRLRQTFAVLLTNPFADIVQTGFPSTASSLDCRFGRYLLLLTGFNILKLFLFYRILQECQEVFQNFLNFSFSRNTLSYGRISHPKKKKPVAGKIRKQVFHQSY